MGSGGDGGACRLVDRQTGDGVAAAAVRASVRACLVCVLGEVLDGSVLLCKVVEQRVVRVDHDVGVRELLGALRHLEHDVLHLLRAHLVHLGLALCHRRLRLLEVIQRVAVHSHRLRELEMVGEAGRRDGARRQHGVRAQLREDLGVIELGGVEVVVWLDAADEGDVGVVEVHAEVLRWRRRRRRVEMR